MLGYNNENIPDSNSLYDLRLEYWPSAINVANVDLKKTSILMHLIHGNTTVSTIIWYVIFLGAKFLINILQSWLRNMLKQRSVK